MATVKIIQVISNDSDYVRVRVSDGRVINLPHNHQTVSAGDEIELEDAPKRGGSPEASAEQPEQPSVAESTERNSAEDGPEHPESTATE